jgi:hypothetical protein
MKRPNDPEAQAALDAWADKIAALEPDVAAGVAAYAGRLASDRRLAKDDRRFAAAQADAIRRALRRVSRTRAKATATKKPGRKPGKNR